MKTLKIWSLIAVLAVAFLGYSCKDDDDELALTNVIVKVEYPKGFEAKEGVAVKARGMAGIEFEMKTDAKGVVEFALPIGTYEFSVSEVRVVNKKFSALNGFTNRTIGSDWKTTDALTIVMTGSTRSQLIIKELYFGGCPKDDGSPRAYSFDAYITLYNNSSEPVDLQNLCFGSVQSNSFFMKYDFEEGKSIPRWFKEDWTPASVGYFYFPNSTTLEPYQEVVVVAYGAIDHTAVHSQSVNLTDSKNYVMYDIDKFDQPYYYKAPSANISTTHYLSAEKYPNVPNTGWTVITSSPNLFLFYPEGQTPTAYANDMTNLDFWKTLPNFPRKKVPASWIVDGIDAFAAGREDDNVKRINPKVDAGHIYFVSGKAYTLYRNVDKDLTESIEGNKEKLVYNYAGGTKDLEPKHGTTDPSGIDAEASVANGAIIIYKDTNNSGNDFHMRAKSSLRK